MLLGIVVILLAFFLPNGNHRRGDARVGGVVMIGPIPILFGSDAKWASIATLLAIVLMILGLLYYVM